YPGPPSVPFFLSSIRCVFVFFCISHWLSDFCLWHNLFFIICDFVSNFPSNFVFFKFQFCHNFGSVVFTNPCRFRPRATCLSVPFPRKWDHNSITAAYTY
ncbi:hypothetical protein B0H10DRAFT_2043860, partial [Mycena sp. CBHHK59/15]